MRIEGKAPPRPENRARSCVSRTACCLASSFTSIENSSGSISESRYEPQWPEVLHFQRFRPGLFLSQIVDVCSTSWHFAHTLIYIYIYIHAHTVYVKFIYSLFIICFQLATIIDDFQDLIPIDSNSIQHISTSSLEFLDKKNAAQRPGRRSTLEECWDETFRGAVRFWGWWIWLAGGVPDVSWQLKKTGWFNWLVQLAGSMLFCFGVVGMELGAQIPSNSHVPFCLQLRLCDPQGCDLNAFGQLLDDESEAVKPQQIVFWTCFDDVQWCLPVMLKAKINQNQQSQFNTIHRKWTTVENLDLPSHFFSCLPRLWITLDLRMACSVPMQSLRRCSRHLPLDKPS